MSASSGRSSIQTGLPKSYPWQRKMGKSGDFRNLNDACPKDEFPLPIPEIMKDNTYGFERMSFMGVQENKNAPEGWEAYFLPYSIWHLLLHCNAVWVEERWRNVKKGNDQNLQRHVAQDGRVLRRRLSRQKQKEGRPPKWSSTDIEGYANTTLEWTP